MHQTNTNQRDSQSGEAQHISISIRSRLISGGLWACTGRILSASVGFAVYSLLAHLLTPGEMGAYFLIAAQVSVAAMFAQLGLNQSVVRLVAESMSNKKPGRARAAIRTTFYYGTMGAVVVSAVLVFGVGKWLAVKVFNSSLIAGVVTLVAAWMMVTAFEGLLSETFRGFHDIRLASFVGGLFSTLVSMICFVFLWGLWGYANLAQVLTLSIIAGFLSNIIAGFLLWEKLRSLKGDCHLLGKEVFAIAWPLLITNLTLYGLNHFPIWIVGAYRPGVEVAMYGAAARLTTVVGMSLLIVNAVVPPLITEMYYQGKKKELERMLGKTATLAAIPAFVAMLAFALFGEPLLSLVFGDRYREGIGVLRLLSIGQFVNVFSGSCGIALIMTGHQRIMMEISIICGIITAASGILLVRDYGAKGVAAAAMSALILQNVLMLLFVRKKAGIWTFAKLSLQGMRENLW